MNNKLLGDSWYPLLKEEMEKDYFLKLTQELIMEYQNGRCYPNPNDIFKVFQLCKFEDVRIIILASDPYPAGNHAHGIALSSLQKETPYSLQMILREVDRDVVKTKGYKQFKEAFPNNDLTPWVKQGIFLLNTVLTVRANEVGSHGHLGWQQFTGKVLEMLWLNTKPKVFLVLGKEAKDSLNKVTKGEKRHLYIEAGHPASGAHGRDKFSGCGFPSRINLYFKRNNLPEIRWVLND